MSVLKLLGCVLFQFIKYVFITIFFIWCLLVVRGTLEYNSLDKNIKYTWYQTEKIRTRVRLINNNGNEYVESRHYTVKKGYEQKLQTYISDFEIMYPSSVGIYIPVEQLTLYLEQKNHIVIWFRKSEGYKICIKGSFCSKMHIDENLEKELHLNLIELDIKE